MVVVMAVYCGGWYLDGLLFGLEDLSVLGFCRYGNGITVGLYGGRGGGGFFHESAAFTSRSIWFATVSLGGPP